MLFAIMSFVNLSDDLQFLSSPGRVKYFFCNSTDIFVCRISIAFTRIINNSSLSYQVASQPAMECIPLVMEPESGFYSDPVVVLDFQSLYPSMIIAYNLCFSTCLGNVVRAKADILGVTSYSPDLHILEDLNLQILITPNGVMYVPSKVILFSYAKILIADLQLSICDLHSSI